MIIDFAARVEIGRKETNDDRALVDGQILDMASHNGSVGNPSLAVICDGCGGYAGGGVAAQSVLESLSCEDPFALSDTDQLDRALENCRAIVMRKKEEMPQYSAMCTTVAGCVFCDDRVVIFHSGDSRVYRHDRWGLARMTRDHSIVQDMIDMGEITPEEALTHPKRNVISRCIGINGPSPEIYVSHTAINPGEKYMICTDGIWESVSDDEIREILDSGVSLCEMADALVEKALAQGSDDNISVCICASQGTVEAVENKPFVLD